MKVGTFAGIILVNVNKKASANILSLSSLRDAGYDVGEDKDKDCYYWNLPNGYKLIFARLGGLYAVKWSQVPEHIRRNAARVLTATVQENKLNFTKKEIEGADKAIEVRKRLGFPGSRALTDALNHTLP